MSALNPRRHATILALVAGFAAPALADRDVVFKNAAGAPANELHVVFASDVKVDSAAPFSAAAPSGQHAFTLSGASVGPGGEVTLHVAGDKEIRVERWWWAADARRIGTVQRDPATQQFTGSIVLSFAITDLKGSFTPVPGAPEQLDEGAVVIPDDAQTFEIKLDCDDSDDHGVSMFAITSDAADPAGGLLSVEPFELALDGDCIGDFVVTVECIADPNDPHDLPHVQMDGAEPADVLVQTMDAQPLKLVIGRLAMDLATLDGAAPEAAKTPGVLVDDAFLTALHGAWGTGDPMYDLNDDGYVDAGDFHAALVNIGREVEQPAMRAAPAITAD